MALRPEYALGNSEFNDFLFACVGEEENGTELTVLSALARLDLDPWAEAVRLSELTREAATNALAAAIHSLPNGDWTESDTQSIATRLVAHLPKHASSRKKPSRTKPLGTKPSLDSNADDQKPKAAIQKWLIWIGLAVPVIVVLLRLFGD